MAVVNTWNVLSMDEYPEFDGEKDVVCKVHWILTGTEGEYTGAVYNSQAVIINSEEPFTPYEELTLEQVIGWVKDALGQEVVAAYEDAVEKQIAEQQNPAVINLPLPWAVPLGPTPA